MYYLIFVTQLNDAHKTIFKSRNRLDIRAHTKQLRRGPTTHLFKMPRARTAPIVGSWCWAAAKFISSCKELSSPRCCLGVCIRVPRIPITGNDAKRAAAWMGRQITEIMGNERLDAHYCGAASTSWTFMNHAKASPILLYIQLSKTDREQKRCKNACSQFIRQPIAAPFVALWGRTRLSTVNPITVVTKIGQSVSKHTGCISAPA